MDMLLHPMLVHFPIALLFASVLFDVASTALMRDSLREGALWLLGLGLLGGLVAAVAGRFAEHAAEKAGVAEALIETHEMLAYVTLGIMAIMFLSRLLLRNRFTIRVLAAYLAVATVGLVAVSATGHTGGNLVYEHGAGVKAAAARTSHLAETVSHR
ncbi:MAG: DUF2231 domain-containing protein [Nitrospira sp.]|nr:DUF2231 domain-containing protein [Nitrospira sp.]